MTNEHDELMDDTSVEGSLSINIDKIKANLHKYSMEKLCDMIVCARYLGVGKEVTTICMEELARRRAAGDLFAFEDYIEKAYNELPPLEFNTLDIRSILNQAIMNSRQALSKRNIK